MRHIKLVMDDKIFEYLKREKHKIERKTAEKISWLDYLLIGVGQKW